MKNLLLIVMLVLGTTLTKAETFEFRVIAASERNVGYSWSNWNSLNGYSLGIYTALEEVTYYRNGITCRNYKIVSVDQGTVDGCEAVIFYVVNDDNTRCTLYLYKRGAYYYLWITYRDKEFMYKMIEL